MNTKLKPAACLLLALLISPPASAADEPHHHDAGMQHGPNGGQVIASQAGFAFKVSVDQERRARIVFLDRESKAVALDGQSVTGIAGERSAPTRLAFAPDTGAREHVLLSDRALPPGAHVQMILMIKTAPDAKAVTERFVLHLH
ncbi:MAG: hypothetical protein H3C27_09955 [Opitutaceae bacterium]|nr:hypothetical protein [Opitutaceae bacterium]